MALSGIFYGTSSNPRIKPQISWEAVQSVAGNYSDVTAKLQYTRSNSGYTTGGTWKGSLSIGGDTLNKTLYMEITYGNVTTVITHTARVYHDGDGKKTITISGTGGITTPAEASLKTTNISATVTLDTIPRTSEISATDCDIGARSTVVISKKNSGFTHTIGYTFGSLSGYISAAGQPVTAAEKISQSVVNFAVPESFYHQIPNSPTGICTLTCDTYQGSTKIGSATATFVVTAKKSLCLPQVSLSAEDILPRTSRLTGNPKVLVLNASRVKCQVTAQAKNGAQIQSMTLLGQPTEGEEELTAVTTAKLTCTATDSRGYRQELTYNAPNIRYIRPTVNVSAKRDTPTGSTATLTVTGQCFRGSFGLEMNSFSLKIYLEDQLVKETTVTLQTDNSYKVSVPLTGLDYQKSYSIRVYGVDALYSAAKIVTLPAGLPVFDWGAGDFQFNVPVYMPRLYVNGKEVTGG